MALSNSQYESIMRVYNRTQLQKKHELTRGLTRSMRKYRRSGR